MEVEVHVCRACRCACEVERMLRCLTTADEALIWVPRACHDEEGELTSMLHPSLSWSHGAALADAARHATATRTLNIGRLLGQ